VHVTDVYVQFADGSLKRPDIAIFCREPDELDDAIRLVPEAISQGVKDVIVFDPTSLMVLHARKNATTRQVSPHPAELECGYRVLVREPEERTEIASSQGAWDSQTPCAYG
jgi:hypothetical protein